MAAPAGPLIQGSTTPMAKETATAASTALPPPASTSAPISAARRCCAATMPWEEEVAGLRVTWEREKADMETPAAAKVTRSEEHTSELQSLMHISYAVFCLKKKTTKDKSDNNK